MSGNGDYISREAMINLVEDDGHANEIDLGWPDGNMAFVEMIKELPAADVRPVKRGKWRERRFSEDVYGAECSVCHTTWDYGTNFCPNCGADMREGS